MNSATSAIHAALVAAGIGPNDEVITTPYTVIVDGSIPIFMGATILTIYNYPLTKKKHEEIREELEALNN